MRIYYTRHNISTQNDMLEKLKAKLEKTIGREMKTPRDFDFIAARIYALTQAHISSTTLKRMWGYLEKEQNHKPQPFTLNILARTAGYKDWESFEKSSEEECDSDFINNECLKVSTLIAGDTIRLTWKPDRIVTIRFEGMDMFTVVESVNSKLNKGDTFHVSYMINGEPLQLYCLVHDGGAPCNYVCGRNGGITFNIL